MGTASFDGTMLTSAGSFDIFVAKYDPNGVLVWAKQADADFPRGIAVDSAGNSYVTGNFAGNATFGPGEGNETTLDSGGLFQDIFVAKYNSNGTLAWAKKAGGTSANDFGRAIAADGSGNVFVTGSFMGTASFDGTMLTSAGSFDIFVAKYNTSGTLLWAKRAGGTSFSEEGKGISVDGSGNSYVTGIFGNNATFGPGEGNETILPAAGGSDIFVAKYDTNGALVWATGVGGMNTDTATGIGVDGAGNSYVTGYFSTSTTIDGTVLNSVGGEDIFVAKFDGNGTPLWANSAGGTANDQGHAIVADAAGNSYLTGYYNTSAVFGFGETNQTVLNAASAFDIFIARYNTDGTLAWTRSAGGGLTAIEEGNGIALDALGNSYVTGTFQGTATFGAGEDNETTLTSTLSLVENDIFVAKFFGENTAGNGTLVDFDADGKTDVAVYQSNNGNWFWVGSTSGFDYHLGFGGNNYHPVPADYDGDGQTDTAVYQQSSGHWFISQSTDGFKTNAAFGGPGYIPIPGDYDGDGKTDIAVYETSTGNWFWIGSTSDFDFHLGFGGADFIPVPGDYDGDGQTDTAVYDTTTGNWFINQSTAGFSVHPSFGGAGFIPVPGDYDGDGKVDIAVYDTGNGNWFYVGSTSGFGYHLAFGGANFIPVPADYDGDGVTDTAVYDTTNGNWFVAQTTSGFTVHPSFGGPGFVPVLPQVTVLRALGVL